VGSGAAFFSKLFAPIAVIPGRGDPRCPGGRGRVRPGPRVGAGAGRVSSIVFVACCQVLIVAW